MCSVGVLFYFVGFVMLIRGQGERREREKRVAEKSGSGMSVPQMERVMMSRRCKGMYVEDERRERKKSCTTRARQAYASGRGLPGCKWWNSWTFVEALDTFSTGSQENSSVVPSNPAHCMR